MGQGNGFDPEFEEELQENRKLEAQLAEEKKKSEEYPDKYLRMTAEFQNFKRRAEKDKADYAQYANQRGLKRLLDVMDSFDAGFISMPAHVKKEPWVEGMRAVERQLLQILEQEGVTPIDVEGKD